MVYTVIMGFTWDVKKGEANAVKHGIFIYSRYYSIR